MVDAEPLLCVVCSTPTRGHDAFEGLRVCGKVRDRIREALDDIAEWWPELIDPDGQRAGGDPGRRATGFASGVPIDIAAIALLDPNLLWEVPGDLRYPPDVLLNWGEQLAVEIGTDPPLSVDSASKLLAKHIGHVCRQEWVADMWDEVRDVRTQIGVVVGETTRRLVGPCPTVIGRTAAADEDRPPVRCGVRLYAPLQGDTISCRACEARWQRPDWNRLGGLIREARRDQAAQASTPAA